MTDPVGTGSSCASRAATRDRSLAATEAELSARLARSYRRLAWLIAQVLIEGTVGTLALSGLWGVYRHPQIFDHPVIVALALVATLWVAVGPSPYGRWLRLSDADTTERSDLARDTDK